MKLKNVQKTANTTASVIVSLPTYANEVRIKNLSAEVVYIGDSSVNTSNGYPLAQNEVLSLGDVGNWDLELEDIYAVTGATTADLRVVYTKQD